MRAQFERDSKHEPRVAEKEPDQSIVMREHFETNVSQCHIVRHFLTFFEYAFFELLVVSIVFLGSFCIWATFVP